MKHPVFTCLVLLSFPFAAFSANEGTAGTDEDLALRVQDLERRLALIDRKFQLLAATSEQELNGASAVFGDAKLLHAQALHALRVEKSPEQAYRYLAALRALHPESAEVREVYPLAAELFQGLYFRNRHAEQNGLWTTSEPVFMFQWLSLFFGEDGVVFPQAEVDRLLVGMPVGLLRDFETFAAARPAMRRWRLSFERDNGIVQSITPHQAE